MSVMKNYVGGGWQDVTGSDYLVARSPFTGDAEFLLPISSEADVSAAVDVATAAQRSWAQRGYEERVVLLREFAELVEQKVADLAEAEHREMGKPAGVAAQFIQSGINAFRNSLDDAKEYPFSEPYGSSGEILTITKHLPVGVAALIVPWNFTVAQILLVLGPILASGNTVVIKPSEKATPSALRMVAETGLPAGVLNVVIGDGTTGAALCAHPGVSYVNFTGSVRTGRKVAELTGSRLARATLELGGKDAAIVDEGVDVPAVATQVAMAGFINSGQICTAVERVFVVAEVAEEFIAALVDQARKFVLHPPNTADEIELGPLADESQLSIVRRHVDDARMRGATVLVGGEQPTRAGYFYPATVLTDVSTNMLVMREETFGPVLAIEIVDTFDTALQRAAQSAYGLALTVFTDQAEHAAAAAEQPVGMVWVNQWQGGGLSRMYEPAGCSGAGLTGGRAAYDAATRGVSVSMPAGLSDALT